MSTSLICNDSIQLLVSVGGGPTSFTVTPSGASVAVPAVLPWCSSGWIEVAHVPPFDSSQIDPIVVAALIGAGFLLYLTPWAAAYGFSALLKLLR